jgi:hypothetical protein
MDRFRGPLKKLVRCPGCFVPEAFRQQYLNGLPQQLFARVSEQLVCLPIDQDDLSLSIHHN